MHRSRTERCANGLRTPPAKVVPFPSAIFRPHQLRLPHAAAASSLRLLRHSRAKQGYYRAILAGTITLLPLAVSVRGRDMINVSDPLWNSHSDPPTSTSVSSAVPFVAVRHLRIDLVLVSIAAGSPADPVLAITVHVDPVDRVLAAAGRVGTHVISTAIRGIVAPTVSLGVIVMRHRPSVIGAVSRSPTTAVGIILMIPCKTTPSTNNKWQRLTNGGAVTARMPQFVKDQARPNVRTGVGASSTGVVVAASRSTVRIHRRSTPIQFDDHLRRPQSSDGSGVIPTIVTVLV